MLSYKTGPSDQGFNCLWVKYGDLSVEIPLNEFYKDPPHLETLYQHIDMYAKTLPNDSAMELMALFASNQNQEHVSSYGDQDEVIRLENNIKRAVELLDYQRWKIFFDQFKSGVLIPETVNNDFTFDPDMGTTRDKTYIYSEYIDLVALIIFIRAISPLYIEYFNYSKLVSDHPNYLLLRLFAGTSLNESAELTKLRTYIEVNQQTLVGTSKNEHLVISAGLSDDDMIDYLVAEVVFNKLLVIDFFHKRCNIVSFIFQTVRYKGSFKTNENSSIRTKNSRGENSREDHSYFEDYRKTSSISIGTAVEIQESLSNPYLLANDLGYSNFDSDAYKRELKYANVLVNTPPENIQIYMLGWFLGRAISPRALFYIERLKLAELFIFAKIVLKDTSHSFIGELLCSRRTPDTPFLNVLIRNSLSKNLLARLRRHYSYAIEEDKISTVEKTIAETSKEITNSVWRPVGSPEYSNRHVTKEGFLDIPNNINDIVCSYVDFVLDHNHEDQ